jgi:hypothetical protein
VTTTAIAADTPANTTQAARTVATKRRRVRRRPGCGSPVTESDALTVTRIGPSEMLIFGIAV